MIGVCLSALTVWRGLAAALFDDHRCSITYFVSCLCICGSVADLDVATTVSATHMPVKLCFLASPAWVS